MNKIEASIKEVINNHVRNTIKEEALLLDWDANMWKNWKNILNPPLTIHKS